MLNRDDLCRSVRESSGEGVICFSNFGKVGVGGTGDLLPFVIFRASLRNGDMEREMVLEPLLDFATWILLGGVKNPLFVWLGVPEALDSLPLAVTSVFAKICRTVSMSLSVRFILSFKLCHRCVDSACLLKHSPFLVTRS